MVVRLAEDVALRVAHWRREDVGRCIRAASGNRVTRRRIVRIVLVDDASPTQVDRSFIGENLGKVRTCTQAPSKISLCLKLQKGYNKIKTLGKIKKIA